MLSEIVATNSLRNILIFMGIMGALAAFVLFLKGWCYLLARNVDQETKKIINDDKAVGIVESEIRKEGYDHFELKSITSLDKPNITSIIVDTGSLEISMEIDNHTGKILSKEKMAR